MNLIKRLFSGQLFSNQHLAPRPRGRHSAVQVANYYIAKANHEEGRHLYPQAVIKLVYFAHAWMLAIHGRPLLNHQVDCWEFGPHFQHLYKGLIQVHNLFAFPIARQPLARFDPEEQRIVDEVYAKYSYLDPVQISALCNQEDSPWHQAWSQRKPWWDDVYLSDAAIQSHYRRQLKQTEPTPSEYPEADQARSRLRAGSEDRCYVQTRL